MRAFMAGYNDFVGGRPAKFCSKNTSYGTEYYRCHETADKHTLLSEPVYITYAVDYIDGFMRAESDTH